MKLLKREDVKKEDKWDLKALYKSDDVWDNDYNKVKELAKDLLKYKNNIMKDANTLLNFYKDNEKMNIMLGKVIIYASLLLDSDSTNNENMQKKEKIESLINDINSMLSFVTPEMLETKYDVVKNYIKENKELEKYAFDLEKMYRFEKYTLSKNEENILTEASNVFGTGEDVFYNFDNTDINLGKIKDENGHLEELTHSNYEKYIESTNKTVRIDAFNHMFNYYKNFKNTITQAFKGSVKEEFFFSKLRGYQNPLHMNLYANDIDVSVYKNLIKIVNDNLYLLHDYIKLKKEILNLDEMHMYDIYLHLTNAVNKDVSFEDGKKIIFEALKPLGKEYLNDLKKAFDERWIDKYPNKGKKSGAYSWGSYGTYPYLLLNYNNTLESVTTMAHELGHSMHSYYSNKNQSYTYSSYPIFLAEIASTVNEVLLNDYLYKNAETKEEKIYYLNDFLDKVKSTIYRQTQFAEFEMNIFDKYEQNIPLTEKELSGTYYELNKKYYGDGIIHDDLIKYEWLRIPHFYSSFYVYQYATGLVCALAIASDILANKKDAKENYLKFLSSGSSNYPLNILKLTGVDITADEPINKAFKMFEEKLSELKKIIKK